MWRKLAGRKAECCAAHPNVDSRSADYCAVKPYIIFNPRAGAATDRKTVLSQLGQLNPTALRITRKAGDAEKWARAALRTKCNYIVVAGGDGTLNGVVNGLGTEAKNVRRRRSNRTSTFFIQPKQSESISFELRANASDIS